MSDLLDKLVESFLKGVAGEGERLLRARTRAWLEQALDGLRRLLIVQYVLMTACFLWAASFLASGLLITEHWESVRERDFPPSLIFTGVVLMVATTGLMLTVRRRLWTRALRSALADSPLKAQRPDAGGLSEARIATIVREQVQAAMEEQAAKANDSRHA